MQQNTPDCDAAAFEKIVAARRRAADPLFDRLLLSQYHRSLADLELLPDPEGRQEVDFVAEFCYDIEDRLRDLLREQRGEEPKHRHRQREARAGGHGSSDTAGDAGPGDTEP